MNILPGESACLACLFPAPPAGMIETCDTGGILNTAVNFAASVEVTEALKFLVGAQDKMRRTLLGRDLWTNDQAEINAAKPRAQCTVAGKGTAHARRRPSSDHAMRPIRCKSMNIIGRLTLPRCSGGWNRTGR